MMIRALDDMMKMNWGTCVIRSRAVSSLTTIFLLRVRYLVVQPGRAPLYSEEVRVLAATASMAAAASMASASNLPGETVWLDDSEAQRLLVEAREATVVARWIDELTAAVTKDLGS